MRSQPSSLQLHQPAAGRRIGVAHGPVDHDALVGECCAKLLGLRPRDRLERPLVALPVPDLGVVLPLETRPHGENDQVEDRPPLPARHLDDARVGEELLEVAPHGAIAGAVGGAEIQQQHADAATADRRVPRRQVLRFGAAAARVHWFLAVQPASQIVAAPDDTRLPLTRRLPRAHSWPPVRPAPARRSRSAHAGARRNALAKVRSRRGIPPAVARAPARWHELPRRWPPQPKDSSSDHGLYAAR